MTTIQSQASALLGQVAGYVGVRTVDMGLRLGLFQELEAQPKGITPKDLAAATQLDPFYTEVWCRAANGAGTIDLVGNDHYQLAPHMATLLLDDTSPAFVGAIFSLMEQPEIFDGFRDDLPTGEGVWWDTCTPEFIANVGGSGAPFNTRLIPDGLDRVPELTELLTGPIRILELACGSGTGLTRLAEHYPDADIVGTDGDAHSLALASQRLALTGFKDRVTLVESPMESLLFDNEFDLITINISMHECRDIDEVCTRILKALRPGGYFVNSDFPFPSDEEGLRTVPGRVMSGIQYFEARIGDQLVPVSYYLELLAKHGFQDIGSFEISPVHSVTYGTK